MTLQDFKKYTTPTYLNDVALAEGIMRKNEIALDELAVFKPGGNKKVKWADLDEALMM